VQEIINAIETRNEELAIRLIRESRLDFSIALPPLNDGDENPPPTPLHYAAKQGLINVIRCLLDHGVYFDAVATWEYPDMFDESDNGSETPSLWAIYYNQVEALKELWKNGLSKSVENSRSAKTYLLSRATKWGHLEMVKWLIEKGFPIDGHDSVVPLNYAFSEGHNQVVEYLLNKGASIDYVADEYEDSPVNIPGFGNLLNSLLINKEGFRFSNKSLVILINKFGIDTEIQILTEGGYNLNRIDHEGINLIQAAILKENLRLIGVLLNIGVNINHTDSKGFHTLDYVLCSQNEEVISLFQSKGFDILERQIQGNKHGLWAVMQGDSEYIVKAIRDGGGEAIQTMKENNVDLNQRTPASLKSPIFIAAEQGNAKVVQLLIKYGADVNISNWEDMTPLYNAVINGHADVVRILIDEGEVVTTDSKDLVLAAIQLNKLDIAFKLLNSGFDLPGNRYIYTVQILTNICEKALESDLGDSIGPLMQITKSCPKSMPSALKFLQRYIQQIGYGNIVEKFKQIAESKNSQYGNNICAIKNSFKEKQISETDKTKKIKEAAKLKYKEAIRLVKSITDFEKVAEDLGPNVVIKLSQVKKIISGMPFSYIQSQIFPQQDLLSKISSFIELEEQIVFTRICKHSPIFPQLHKENNDDHPESKVQEIGEDEYALVMDNIN